MSPPKRASISGLGGEGYREAMSRRYARGETPWDTGVPSAELIRAIDEGELPGKTVLELGCGTGTNSVELARRGYAVTAVDLIEDPIRRARTRAKRAGVKVDFRVGDLTQIDLGGPYDLLFDSGLYHGIRNRDLAGLLVALSRASRPGTRWLCLAGNANEPHPTGPPAVREEEFRSELEPMFRVLRVRPFRFDLGRDLQPLAWSILMERR